MTSEFFVVFAVSLSIVWFVLVLARELVLMFIAWMGWDESDWFH